MGPTSFGYLCQRYADLYLFPPLLSSHSQLYLARRESRALPLVRSHFHPSSLVRCVVSGLRRVQGFPLLGNSAHVAARSPNLSEECTCQHQPRLWEGG